ncbi:hypothetical protein C9374_002139 [Naegleria lovaniensis]|uniref:Tetratricopeptide repeat protein n=1 Tax=Naegleria lovaniensis TaxID=51637 RepID=A0AA88GVX3_NAELO|nr:uncharacterized protein C9374_002139 [Naegleria lovaniensis]KAG2387104.1 hypothetical protein C9374_002139 [Naegleria lovaniensis]
MLKQHRSCHSFARKIFKVILGPCLNRTTTTPSSQQFFLFGNVSFHNHEPQHREFHKCIVFYQTEKKSPELEMADLRTQIVEAFEQQSYALAATISSKLIQRLTTMTSEHSLSAQDKKTLVFAYLARGWVQNSIEDLSKSIELNPLLVNGYYFRARVYLTLNQMDKAFQDIETCLSLNPDCTEAYLTRAFIYEQGQDYEKAIEDYERIIHIHPRVRQDPQILDRLAGLYWRVARASLDVNIDQWHTNLEKGNQLCIETIEILSNRIENHSDTNFTVGSLGHGRHFGVVALDGTLIDNNTSHDAPLHSAEKCHRIRLCSNIASNYVGMNQHQQALQYYTKAIKFIHEMEQENGLSTAMLFAYYQAYMNRGFLLMQYFKKYDLALKDFMKAFDIADSSRADDKTPQWETQKYQIYVAHSELAMLHVNMNEIDKACEHVLRAEIALLEICESRATTITDSPVNDMTHESNTENKNSQQVEKVETPFPFNLFLCGNSLKQFALNIAQTYPNCLWIGNALYSLDVLCVLEGDYENALKLLNIYIDEQHLQEHLEIIYANRADVKIKLGKYHEAIQDCNSSLELDPNYYAAFFNRGEAYFHLQELDKAKHDFDLALEKAPFLKKELLNLWPTFDEYQLSNTQND